MDDHVEQLRYLLALLRIPRMGASKLTEILEQYSDLRETIDAQDNCRVIPGVANWSQVEKDLRWMEAPNHFIITKQDATFPPLLKEIPGAPPVLFVEGNVELLAKPGIAIVGSRNPTPLGCETAIAFAHHFSETGFMVVSGLAHGIDGAAHKGALLGSGGTVAVLGNGLDMLYPLNHQVLAGEIANKGALVSEFPIGTPPLKTHFPRRNRIISGLSLGTLVVEATLNSGSLITAKYALEQGREVFAIPGSIHSPVAKGCHALIREGAKLVETAEDVLEELGALTKYVIRAKTGKKRETERSLAFLDSKHEALLAHVGYESTPVDVVIARCGLTAGVVSSMLLELELNGYVASVPGGYARRLN